MNLNSPVREIKGIGAKTEQLFQQLGVYTIGDILLYFPRDYEKYPDLCDVDQVVEGRKKCFVCVCEKDTHRQYPFPPAGGFAGSERRESDPASDLVSQSLYPITDPSRRMVRFLWKSQPER